MVDLVFLTRDGCLNTPDMVNNLDDALKALGLKTDYGYIDIGTLPKSDARTGYPTPTQGRPTMRRICVSARSVRPSSRGRVGVFASW